jgi:hypothetical protein
MTPRRLSALLMVVLLGCSGPQRFIRLDTGQGEALIHLPRAHAVQPVEVGREEFQHSLQQLALEVRLIGSPRATVWRMFQLDALSGDFLYLPRERKLVPVGPGFPLEGALTEEEEKLTRDYQGWCRRAYGAEGDCLGGALVGGRYMDLQGRYTLALALSKSPVLDEMQAALGEMVSFQAVFSAVLWTVGTLLFLLALPEPVTKALAAVMTTVLVLWVGVDTLFNLIAGWLRLTEEVKEAHTFVEIREAGERFGKVIGRDAARVFAMLAMAAIGQTAQGFAAKVPTLPGSAQVAMQAEAEVDIWLPAVGAVREVAVTAEGLNVALPPGAVAMAARAARGNNADQHHIATIANDVSSARGGPWTPRFRALFAKAGMKLDDPANRMPLEGHYGPHPERYHQLVFERLRRATAACRSVEACREELGTALRRLSREIATPGTELNQLVTRAKPR